MDDLTPDLRVAAYEVTCLPADHPASRHFTIRVEHRDGDRWAITWRGLTLGHDSGWDTDQRPSDSTDEWVADHRFTLTVALQVAFREINEITVHGLTAAQVLKRGDR